MQGTPPTNSSSRASSRRDRPIPEVLLCLAHQVFELKRLLAVATTSSMRSLRAYRTCLSAVVVTRFHRKAAAFVHNEVSATMDQKNALLFAALHGVSSE